MSSDDEVLSGGPASENEAVDVVVTAGATPPGPFGAPRSALAENIQRKGSNSYYYAHAGTLEKAPALSYDGAPRMLGKEVVEVPAAVTPITKFSWCDNKKNVKVYVEVPGADTLPEDVFNLGWGEKSIHFRYTLGGATCALAIPELHDPITHASLSRRGDRVTLTLTKASEFSWYELTRKK